MLKKLGVSAIALLAVLMVVTPPAANAAVRFGVYVGGPAYPYPAYTNPYPAYAPYGYPYGYVNPYVYSYPYVSPGYVYPYGYLGGYWGGRYYGGVSRGYVRGGGRVVTRGGFRTGRR